MRYIEVLRQVKILFTLVYCSSIGSVYLKIESVHGRTATRCKFLKTDSIRRQESLTRKAISDYNAFSQNFGYKM